jgi:hypothetical protein
MMVYETDETEGDFGVYLRNQPPPSATITVTVDPNGEGDAPNEDITLIGGTEPNNIVTLTFNNGNWDVPQTVIFKAIDDAIAEPPDLLESQNILVSSSWPGHESDANFVGETYTKVKVMDNDQANIMFTYTLAEKHAVYADYIPGTTNPIQLWEELRVRYGTPYIRWRKIGVTLQVPPSGGPVKLQAEVTGDIIGDNLPLTDPCLPFPETPEPNGLIFTAANYDTRQPIKIWGVDDAVLQVLGEEGEYPSTDGGQNYQAQVVFTVVDDGGDERYTGIVKEVQIDIEDNECGAFGRLPLDVGNPNAFTDPNYVDDDGNPLPDCYVNIWDAIWLVTEWLDCSDPQDPACESYL